MLSYFCHENAKSCFDALIEKEGFVQVQEREHHTIYDPKKLA
jgi:hypothetical protein